MKLVIAIVQDPDAGQLMTKLVQAGFGATKLASTGGFLRRGNTTILIGVADDRVQAAAGIIRQVCRHRRERVPAGSEVEVAGATVFVLSVDRFERV